MSSDNGIYILITQGKLELPREYRVIHAQAIKNINYNADESGFNLIELWKYFKDSEVFLTKEEAFKKATQLYDIIFNDDFCPYIEYGIQEIRAYNIEFPKEQPRCCNNPIPLKVTNLNGDIVNNWCGNCGSYL
jgi:hypothetical protein